MGEEELRTQIRYGLSEHSFGWVWQITEEEFQKFAEMCWDKNEIKILGKSGITASILAKVAISRLAQKRYSLKVNKQDMALCPFHNDTEPSLKFYDEQGRFHCFGCNADGNTIEFVKRMEKWLKKK